MKQKYVLLKDNNKNQFIIREFAELDKDTLSLLCEEVYHKADVESAIKEGRDILISVLRTKNLYPAGVYAKAIADAVTEMFKSEDELSRDLFFDDIDLLIKEREIEEAKNMDGDSEDIEELLGDDYKDDDDYEEKGSIEKINTTLKVAGDEYAEGDEKG